MHIAHSGPDLGVLVWSDILGDEIYQSPIPLQQGEHLDGTVDRFCDSRFDSWRGWRFSGWRRNKRSLPLAYLRGDLRRDFTLGEHRCETPKSVRKSFSKFHLLPSWRNLRN